MNMIYIAIVEKEMNKKNLIKKLFHLKIESEFSKYIKFIHKEMSCVILTTQNGQPMNNSLTMHATRDVIKN
jgi:uncharacterized membrane protein YjjP (DUF1212 family)